MRITFCVAVRDHGHVSDEILRCFPQLGDRVIGEPSVECTDCRVEIGNVGVNQLDPLERRQLQQPEEPVNLTEEPVILEDADRELQLSHRQVAPHQ